jgi:hypothetical protein
MKKQIMKPNYTFCIFLKLLVAWGVTVASSLALSAYANCTAPPANLVGWWQAEGNASDIIGSNNGVLMNGAGFASGKVGQAFTFSGANQFVRIPDAPSLNPVNALTLEAWVYVSAYPTIDIVTIIGKEDPAGVHQYQLTLWNTQGRWCFRPTIVVAGNYVYMAGNTSVQTGQWYHIATTYDGSTVNLYVNGQLDGTAPASGTVATSPQPLRIGGDETGWFFNGLVDEVSLYNRGLSGSEIQAIYNAGSAGKCTTSTPPTIYAQPTNQTVVAGQTVAFTVGAGGTLPLSYQWTLNDAMIPGATTSSLILPAVQASQAGNYAVVITNSVGSVTSSVAVLTVNSTPPCAGTPVPTGLIGWWQAEGNANDETGANNGALINGTAFVTGEVGQAFSFNGVNQFVRIPDSPALDPTNALSLEAWVYVTAYPGLDIVTIIGKEDPAGVHQYQLTLWNTQGRWCFRPTIVVNGVGAYMAGNTAVQLGQWYHIATTYDGNSVKLYVNGNLDGNVPASGTVATSTQPLRIGGDETGWFFPGFVDEVSLYGRALFASEIQGIYAAGHAGKCTIPVAPTIYAQPTNQAVFATQAVNFTVGVNGTQPLGYQWNFNGGALDGATTSSLTLANVESGQAGTYTVVVTNSVGSVTSSPAILTVNPPPPCAPVPVGLVSWWQGEGTPNDVTGLNNGSVLNDVSYAPGFVGQAFAFDGSGSYVQVPNSASLNLTNELTLELWYKDTGCPTGNHFYGLITKRAPFPSGANFGLSFYLGSPSYLQAYVQDPNYPGYQNTTSALPTPGQFHHVAVTYSQSTSEQVEVRIYVDGALVDLGVLSGNLARTLNTAPVTIGSDDTFEDFFVGLIDEPTIYARALSASEIQAIYNAGVSGKCQTPYPAAIYSQPSNQTVIVGQTATFAVRASGTAPLTYQWNLNGAAIGGATASSLVLTNVQFSQAGTYTVLVTNAVGSVLSSNAVLTVNPPPPCDTPPAGLVSWWAGEGDAGDVVGGNSGTLSNAVTFAPGLVGEAFTFTAPNQIVVVPDSASLNPTNAISIEGWMRVTGYPPVDASVIAAKEDAYGVRQYELDILHTGSQLVFISSIAVPSGFLSYIGTNSIQLNSWAHVAMTYDGSLLSLYVNGKLDGTRPVTGPITTGSSSFTIGGLGAGPWSFFGQVDELSLYNRALSTSDIQGIYNAGMSGKCSLPVPPVISLEPASQTLTIGQTASFNVVAGGMRPLSYQWTFNGAAVGGATTPSLVITNVQHNQSGDYAVVITNAVGSVTSSNAVLTVNFPPANILAENSAADAFGNVTVPIVLNANGNENALGFSLNFNPALLSYVGTALGGGAAGATLLVNSNQAANGQLGIALSLPTGMSFGAGTQEVVDVSFTAAVLTNATVAQVTFGDNPTSRKLSDPQANSLAANFIGGTVSIPAADFEGDVSPRPNGDKAVTITDWVLVGRYAARLDYPTNASEYQRADCAPRSTLGDGAITVADWVQTGRYAVGLDPATRAGGPTNDVGPMIANLASRPKPKGVTRQVRVANVNLVQGQSGTVSVYLDAQGDENALSFSVAFDPTVLGYVIASVGADAPGATLVINTNQASAGKAAFELAMPIGSSFTAGTKEILKLNLGTVPSDAGMYPVALTDQPVVRQVVDAAATLLTATYQNGSVTVNPPPSLTAMRLQQNISLSWPLWATNFVLQEADGTLMPSLNWSNVAVAFSVTNDAAIVTLPISGTTKFYRLQK